MAKPIRGLTPAARALGFTRGNYVPTGMIRWRIDQLHVCTTGLEIAREFWHRRAKDFPRPIKRAVVRAAIVAHRANRQLYYDVTRGRF